MHSLGDVEKTKPLEVTLVTRREDYMWVVEFMRDGFRWYKIIPDNELIEPEDFKKFLNELIKEVQNGV